MRCKKVIRKIAGVMMAAVIICGMSLTYIQTADAAENDDLFNNIPVSKTNAELTMLNEKIAIDAYDELVERMGIVIPSDYRYPNYPDDFGGAYYDGGYLHICLTDNTSDAQTYYRSLVSNPDVIVFEHVDDSYNELYNTMMNVVTDNVDDISSAAVNVCDNVVEIGMPVDYNGEKAKQIATKACEKNIVVVDEEKASCATKLVGGQRISRTGSNGTMTICGTWNGKSAILTAGHCVVTGVTYRHLSNSGTELGTGAYRKYNSNQFYDYGVITLSGDYTLSNLVMYSSGTQAITSRQTSTSSLQGTTIWKYGSTKGFATAKIEATNAVASYADGTTLYGMNKASFVTGTGYKGDSGGPVYLNNVLYGIYSGDNSNPNDASYFWYTPIYGVTDFTIRTN